MSKIVDEIRKELKLNADEEIRESSQRYFKEEFKCYGMKTSTARIIALRYYKEVKGLDKKEIFQLCEELYSSGYSEEAFVASTWLPKLAGSFESGDINIFRHWIDSYIDNWAKCDTFCNHIMDALILKYPERINDLKDWTGSENRWLRRAAAVSLILPAKHGEFMEEALAIAELLLDDEDEMVQKGYGWLLKEASRLHQREVFDFVVRHRKVMPRTSLRYAIELMPAELKAEAMKRD